MSAGAPAGPRDGWTGALLIGGRSQRMGTDKLELRLTDGRRLVDLAAASLRAACVRCLAVGRPGSQSLGLEGFEALGDAEPGGGPLAGLVAALEECRTPWLLLSGGDMPGVTAAGLAALQAEAERDPSRALFLGHGAQIAPLPSAWPSSLGAQVRQRFQCGERALYRALSLELCRTWSYSLGSKIGGPFRSLNTPEDWVEYLGSAGSAPEPP